jgi:general secretion pathway protein A
VAGSHGGVKFSRRALAAIYRLSAGIPRQINLLCDRAMLSAYVQSSTLIEAKQVRQAWSELAGQDGGAVPHLTAGLPRRKFLLLQGLALGVALTVGGGAWLGLNRTKLLEVPVVVPGETSETPASAAANVPEEAGRPAGGMHLTRLPDLVTDSCSPRQAQQATSEPSNNGISAGHPTAGRSAGASTGGVVEASGVSRRSFPGEVLLRALLVEHRRDLQQSGAHAKATLAQVASSFGLEMLPIRIQLNRLKQFRVASLVETSVSNTSEPTFLIVRSVSSEGVELIDAVGEVTRLAEAEFANSWSGQAYLFHRRGPKLQGTLSWGRHSPEVRALQEGLSELGYLRIEPSGFFDEETTEAVRRLQRDHALQVDGAAGPATKIVLYHLVGRSLGEVWQE